MSPHVFTDTFIYGESLVCGWNVSRPALPRTYIFGQVFNIEQWALHGQRPYLIIIEIK